MPLPPLDPELQSALAAAESKLADFGDFLVLVWGGGRRDSEGYQKRIKVRDHLRIAIGRDSAAELPEEINDDPSERLLVERLGIIETQRVQLRHCDAVVTIVSSEGPYAEAIQFREHLALMGIAFVESNYAERLEASAFVRDAFAPLKVVVVTQEQLRECHLIRGEAAKFVLGLRQAKLERAGPYQT